MRRNLFETNDPFALKNGIELVSFKVFDNVTCTQRPTDFDAVDLGCGAQTKVHAEITLRGIAPAAPDLVGLRHASRGKLMRAPIASRLLLVPANSRLTQ